MVIFKKWWFYCLVAVYLVFGAWYGGVSYRVYHKPDNYAYWSRMMLYPVSNVMKYGWSCNNTFQEKRVTEEWQCDFQGIYSRPFGADTPLYFLEEFSYQEVSYRIMMTPGWLVDAVYNLLVIGVTFIVSALVILWVVFVVTMPSLLIHLFVWLFSLLL